MRPLRPLALVALLAVLAVVYCAGTDVTVIGTPDGTTAVVSGDGGPAVLVDKDGIHEPPTPTPLAITPRYPIKPPDPTATPKPS